MKKFEHFSRPLVEAGRLDNGMNPIDGRLMSKIYGAQRNLLHCISPESNISLLHIIVYYSGNRAKMLPIKMLFFFFL